jgi:hypothetical protein
MTWRKHVGKSKSFKFKYHFHEASLSIELAAPGASGRAGYRKMAEDPAILLMWVCPSEKHFSR